MKKISWGIIGCGDVTEIKSGPAFSLVPNSELIAVMRRDASKAEDYAKRHGVKKWYSDAADLINDTDVNAIYIATPPAYHEKYTLQAFNAGKPVYLEKPMALNSEESKRMDEAAAKYSCKLSVAHYRRSQQRFIKIRQLLTDNVFGEIKSVDLQFRQAFSPGTENTWRVDPAISGGGLFHDLAPHQLDLMIFFFGKPTEVHGTSLNRAHFYEADDQITASILFGNKVKFTGVWDFNADPEEETDICEIQGMNGSIRFSVFGNFCQLNTNGKSEHMDFNPLTHVQQPMIEQVVNYFLGVGSNPCSAEDGVEVMTMIDQITAKN